jgi:hypothetical protein
MADEDLDEATRHEMVAAQLRGEERTKGQAPEAVMAAVAEELRKAGLEPDEGELRRRYDAVDPDLPLTADEEQSGS